MDQLDPVEIRVLGCLLEKEATTPEYYPLTLNSLVTEWVRDWKTSPYAQAIYPYFEWYAPRISSIVERLESTPELAAAR